MSMTSLLGGALSWAYANPGTASALVAGDATLAASLVLRLIPHDATNPTLVRVRRVAEWVALNAQPTLLAVERALDAARKPVPGRVS